MISLHSTNGCKDRMKKSSDARGDINKNKVLEFIKTKSLKDWVGVQVNEIVYHTNLSRPTVTTHLNALVAEDKIKKTKRGAYLPTEIFDDKVYDGWSYFEDYLNTNHPFIVNNPNNLDLIDVGNILLNVIKNDFNVTEASLKKYMFEYANKIGAYIVYVFIESLRSRRNVKSDDVRSILTEQFLTEALPLMDLLERFLRNIPINATEKGYYKVNDSALKRLCEVYADLYPYAYKLIEGGYQKFGNALFSNIDEAEEKNTNCIHEWKKRYVHKIGYRYHCPKCDRIEAFLEDIGGGTANA